VIDVYDPPEIAFPAGADLGEGPLWDDGRGELIWLDITRHQVHRLDPRTGRDRAIDVGQPVGAVGLRSGGGLIAAVRDGFARIGVTGDLTFVARTEAENTATRMNDGKVDPAGRFWAGTMAFDVRSGAGSLYRLAPDGTVERVLTELTIPNGMDWSADRTRMYFIDSTTRRIDRFDYDDATGAIRDRRPFCHVAGDGMPDGMTLDSEGYLWVAVWGGAAVLRYAPDGRLVGQVTVPVTQVTSCAFGGPDLRDLYITTASRGLSAEERSQQSHAGAVFVCQPGPQGQAPHHFGG